jgi:hypothetical protein
MRWENVWGCGLFSALGLSTGRAGVASTLPLHHCMWYSAVQSPWVGLLLPAHHCVVNTTTLRVFFFLVLGFPLPFLSASSLVAKGAELFSKLKKSAATGATKGKDLKYFTTTKKGAWHCPGQGWVTVDGGGGGGSFRYQPAVRTVKAAVGVRWCTHSPARPHPHLLSAFPFTPPLLKMCTRS